MTCRWLGRPVPDLLKAYNVLTGADLAGSQAFLMESPSPLALKCFLVFTPENHPRPRWSNMSLGTTPTFSSLSRSAEARQPDWAIPLGTRLFLDTLARIGRPSPKRA